MVPLSSPIGRLDGCCRLDDEGASRFGSIVSPGHIPHSGSHSRSDRLGRDCRSLDL
jgi:hypothetical protein